jgi:hypothetical protein
VPFLRVIRDKRGYETTYLIHWYREGNRQHSRILYVFRSPGAVRVGREPLEPDVLRQIEAEHPDIAFDWRVVWDNQQVVDVAHEPRRRRPAREDNADTAPVAPRPVEPPPAPPRFALPPKIEGDTPDEQIAFLAKLYLVVCEHIPQRTPDPARQEVLLALAERLNPAAWTDADQITSGLQEAAEALERLSHVFAKRRRRARKRPKPDAESSRSAPDGSDDETGVEVAGDAASEDSADSDTSSDH